MERPGELFARQFDGDMTLAWRAEKLYQGGFTEQQAAVLANCAGVDLHNALDLLARGLRSGASVEVIFDVLAE